MGIGTMSSSMWQLPVFLFFASIANGWFLARALRDHVTSSDTAVTRALLALASAQLVWVLPCFLQCLMTLISDGGSSWWVASDNDTGCELMGFYSVFASSAGQLLVLQLAFVTYMHLVRKTVIDPLHIAVGSALSFIIALVLCMLPYWGVGSFAYSGEGFCYIDWSSAGQVVAMELITVPSLLLVTYFFVATALASTEVTELDMCVRDPPPPPAWWWWVFLIAYLSAWILWIPAAFIGLGSDDPFPSMFPQGYMIAGGVLGHLQALINPFLYGYFWRSWFLSVQVMQLDVEDMAQYDTTAMSAPLEGISKGSGSGAPQSGQVEDIKGEPPTSEAGATSHPCCVTVVP